MTLFYVVKAKSMEPRLDGTTGRGDAVEEAMDIIKIAERYDLGSVENSWFEAWYVNRAPVCAWRPGELASLKKARISFEQEMIDQGFANAPSWDVRSFVSVVVSRVYKYPVDRMILEPT
jgi:hypothetical protein